MALLLQLTQTLAHGFQGFWDRWPRKEARKDANKAWTKLNPSPELEQTIHAALDWQVPMLLEREPQYRPLAATWIRGERWDDQPPAPKPTMTRNRATVRPMTSEQLHQQQAVMKIEYLIKGGMEKEQAKRQVYLEMGWIRE